MIKVNPVSLANVKQSNSRKNQPSFKLSFVKPEITAEKGAKIFTECVKGHQWDDFLRFLESANNYHDQALINAFGGARVKAGFKFFQKEDGYSRKSLKWYAQVFLTAPKEDSNLLSPFHVLPLRWRIANFEGRTVELKPIKVSEDFFNTIRKRLLDLDKSVTNIKEETRAWIKIRGPIDA